MSSCLPCAWSDSTIRDTKEFLACFFGAPGVRGVLKFGIEQTLSVCYYKV